MGEAERSAQGESRVIRPTFFPFPSPGPLSRAFSSRLSLHLSSSSSSCVSHSTPELYLLLPLPVLLLRLSLPPSHCSDISITPRHAGSSAISHSRVAPALPSASFPSSLAVLYDAIHPRVHHPSQGHHSSEEDDPRRVRLHFTRTCTHVCPAHRPSNAGGGISLILDATPFAYQRHSQSPHTVERLLVSVGHRRLSVEVRGFLLRKVRPVFNPISHRALTLFVHQEWCSLLGTSSLF